MQAEQQHHTDSEQALKQILKDVAKNQLAMTYEELVQLINRPEIDRILGCLFGAFLADSIGSFCEFKSKATCMKQSKQAMEMTGGGPFYLQPGQVTDDSEMALHMLAGLLSYNSKVQLQKQLPVILVSIAKEYIQWWKNIPFDIGYTCRAAVVKLQQNIEPQKQLYPQKQTQQPQHQKTPQQEYKCLQKAFRDIQQVNEKSLSNGFLMRASPLACFTALISFYKPTQIPFLNSLIFQQTNMTHSNHICVFANLTYMELLSGLILRKDFSEITNILKLLQQKYKGVPEDDVMGSAIQQAILTHKNNDKDLMVADSRGSGFFKVAFYYTIYTFRQIATKYKSEADFNNYDIYKNAIKFTIEQGGDTDTNACIVGAAVGSIVGFKNLPPEYLVKALSLRLHKSQHRKSQGFYNPVNGLINMIKLVKKFM